ncbi:MAG: hypothetical protein JRF33_06255 [Deltaproteobacteria bacterium]|nr:hypothetical protein [Deltaproteobacteria bacterium]
MDTYITFFVVVLGFGFFILLLVFGLKQAKKTKERRRVMLQTLADKLSGRVQPATFTRRAELHFPHLGKECRLVFYSTGGKHPTYYTRFFLQMGSKPPFSTHIYKEGFFQSLGKKMGFQDIQVGDSGFDDKFMIKGIQEARVQQFLSQKVREAILQLETLSKSHDIDVATTDQELRIQKLSWLDKLNTLGPFIKLSLVVAEGYLSACRLTGSIGPDTSATTSKTCAVCLDELKGSSRSCPACGAVHHPECWTLNDGCGACAHKET